MAPKNKFYFTKDTENAIVAYNKLDDQKLRSKIYKEKIEKPLNKLAESIINRYKFPYFQEATEDLQTEVVSFLVLNMSKYEQDIGKAFSYFSIIARNHLILNNTDEYKHRKIEQRIDAVDGSQTIDIIDEAQDRRVNDDTPEFVKMMVNYWENNLSYIFTKRQEMMIADAIITLFKRSHSIENFNKKHLYLLIREMTGLRTQYITSVVNKMKEHVIKLQNKYDNIGYFNTNESLGDFM